MFLVLFMEQAVPILERLLEDLRLAQSSTKHTLSFLHYRIPEGLLPLGGTQPSGCCMPEVFSFQA